PRECHHRRRDRGDGRRPTPGQGALWDRARARGAGPRCGQVPERLGAGMIAQGWLERLGRRPVRKPRSAGARGARPPGPQGNRAASAPGQRARRGGSRRYARRLVAASVIALVLAGGWLWLRDSSLVTVRRVTVTGESGPDATRIQAALIGAGRN